MSLATIDGNLYLFGGSGVAAKCYNDLMVFEVAVQQWHKCIIPE